MHKETSSRVSTIASNILAAAFTTVPPTVENHNALLADAKTLAGSCMSQDETAGQAIEKSFVDRLRDERSDLSQKLEKLGAFIASPAFKVVPERHKEMLVRQGAIMSEYLAVLDERLADPAISERSKPSEPEFMGTNQ